MSISKSTLVNTITTALNKQDEYNEVKYLPRSEATTVLRYKGTVANFGALPISGNEVGDVYNVQTYTTATDINGDVVHAGDNVAYTGEGWDALGGTINLSNYATKSDLTQSIGDANETITDEEIYAAVAAANPGIQLGTAADTPAGGGE